MFHLKKITLAHVISMLLVFLLNACSSKQVIHNSDPISKKQQAPQGKVSAKINAQTPRETIIYEAETAELYSVKKGDTLWDISTHFLRDPWFWPEIWYKNPQIDNPHLIYPGDRLAIIYVDGQKRVQLIKRGKVYKQGKGLKVVKISPRIHSQAIDSSIPSIPIDTIRQLLARPILIDEQELADAAYILSSVDQHLANSIGDIIYVRGIEPKEKQGKYHIFRPNKPIKDPISEEVLGYESLYLGEAKIIRHGDPASLRVTSSTREILRDDRLIPVNNSDIERDFFPKPAKQEIDGRVISILDSISQVGQFNTIAINLGADNDIKVGNLVQINHLGKIIRDHNEADPNFLIKLPNERSAIAIVIKNYEKMSFCLILEATIPVRLNDLVVTP
ncbi:Uncharacterized protein with LysM domain, COG1652 [uncultured Candidatus Thioglobus sp.]|nr:Uncharacterized protein with LysM domain, COG1652 [uncultured Candidatus Thioglobus sp.]